MSAKKKLKKFSETDSSVPLWIQSLATATGLVDETPESKLRTRLRFQAEEDKQGLYVPPDMAELQPASLRYLHALSRQHGLTLIEDRRRSSITPIVDRRDKMPPTMAIGISLLMKQLGMPGMIKPLSNPHRLHAESECIALPRLIRMAARAVDQSKRSVVLPNRLLNNLMNNESHPIAGYACRYRSEAEQRVLCHFDSNNFRAIGYSTGEQFVLHVILGGGPAALPCIWVNRHTLTQTDFQLQLYKAERPAADLGLLYATYYLDMAQAPCPWWLQGEQNQHLRVLKRVSLMHQSKAS
ncbi:MAG: hypothetical protein KTR32_17965 [Granulosicoccus sp.]|nr:hypothetical protein [Granulosicoccus sp.]